MHGAKDSESLRQQVLITIALYSEKKILEKNGSIKKLQFRTILLPYKKCVTEKSTYVNKGYNLLTVLLSIPFNKYPDLSHQTWPGHHPDHNTIFHLDAWKKEDTYKKLKKLIYIPEIKPCGLGPRILDVEAFWYNTEIKIIYFVPLQWIPCIVHCVWSHGLLWP